MFERPHHQRIAQVLLALNGPLLRKHCCLFGGGTAVALHYGEYREKDDEICEIATLSPLDMITCKLLANSDRWADDGIFSRDLIDLIDLAMMQPSVNLLRRAVTKAEQAYGNAVTRDLGKAIDKMQIRRDWLDRCVKAMAIHTPKALLWERIRTLKRNLKYGANLSC